MRVKLRGIVTWGKEITIMTAKKFLLESCEHSVIVLLPWDEILLQSVFFFQLPSPPTAKRIEISQQVTYQRVIMSLTINRAFESWRSDALSTYQLNWQGGWTGRKLICNIQVLDFLEWGFLWKLFLSKKKPWPSWSIIIQFKGILTTSYAYHT